MATNKKESETTISKSIRDALTALGIWNIRIQSGMIKIGQRFVHLAPKGTSDILVLSYNSMNENPNGKAGWLEIKTETGKVSEDQIKFQEKCRQANVKSAIVRSAQEAIDTIKNWVKEDKNES